MDWKDRVKELRRVKASELRRNPGNYRQHGEEQRSAFRGLLAEVGFAGALLARELEDGSLELIDGELRADEARDEEVPVLILDVDEAEANLLLASHDELTAMAEVASDRYHSLLLKLRPQDADLRRFVADRLATAENNAVSGEGVSAGMNEGMPAMELVPHEHYDYVLVLARTIQEWNQLCDLLGLKMVQSSGVKRTHIGIGRGVPASKLIGLLEDGKLSDCSAKSSSGAKRSKGSDASA